MKLNDVQVLSVVESSSGILQNQTSFIIPQTGLALNDSKGLKKAEELFLEKCKEISGDDLNLDKSELLDNGNYTSPDGTKEVSLMWSENVYS